MTGPNQKIILEGSRERQGDFVFTVNELGEYSFCFSNDMSTFAEKMVDFEIAVRNSTFRRWQAQRLTINRRLKTKHVRSSLQNRAHLLNTFPLSKSPFSNSQVNSPLSLAIKNIFVPVKTAISVQFVRLNLEYSISRLSSPL